MLIIKTTDQLIKFKDSFEEVSDYSIHIREVNWNKVKRAYAGIEIQNYHEIKREGYNSMLQCIWFFGWDVSSGCIWDLSIIKKVIHAS